MNQTKLSAVIEESLTFNNPIGSVKLNEMIDLIPLGEGDRLIDIGAGTCEAAIRFVEKYGCLATAVELSEHAIETARRRAEDRIRTNMLSFFNKDVNELDVIAESYDLGVCIGSTHAIGDLKSSLEALKKWVKKDGFILIGEGYWKQRPCAEYLEALGGEESELQKHDENIWTGEALGLTPLWAMTASEDDWDRFEWSYAKAIEDYGFANPEDPDCPAMLKRIRDWKRTYNKWGRDTLGFGLYLFRNG